MHVLVYQLHPATGSAVVLDGSVNVDGGAVTGATTVTASGVITGGSVTDGTPRSVVEQLSNHDHRIWFSHGWFFRC